MHIAARRARGHAGDPDAHPGGRLQVHLVKPRTAHRLRSATQSSLPPPSAACCLTYGARGEGEQAPAQSNGADQEAHASLRQALQDSIVGNVVHEQARCGAVRFFQSAVLLRPTSPTTTQAEQRPHTCLRHNRLPASRCLGRGQPARTCVRTWTAARAHSKSLKVSVAARAPQRMRCPGNWRAAAAPETRAPAKTASTANCIAVQVSEGQITHRAPPMLT